jgi:2-(1,2-epoxy-1,2-dihydrophenyl)acetyl-CoA isomerase
MIATEQRDSITILRLARPQQRNAMIPTLLEALSNTLAEAAKSTSRPIVLTGSGASFCVGADLNWLAALTNPADGVRELVQLHHQAILQMHELTVPLIAAVNGSAAGGGLSFALAADYALAAESASFTAAYFRLGLTPDGGSTLFLTQAIGAPRARELLLTNRRLNATEALAWGMLNEVLPDETLLDRAIAFANSLAGVPPESLVRTRRLLAPSLASQLEQEAEAICTAARGDFFQHAITEFRNTHPRM